VSEVHIGKLIRLVLDAPDEAAARAQVGEMCERLLANPVIEAYEIEISELAPNA
jgi:phosphoribosylformylglycinamidine synthase